MINTTIKIFAVLSLFLVITGCKKHQNPPDPGKAILTFPAQNSACTTGTVTSATQSSITFTWVASDNTDSYDIGIKNLLTNTLTTLSSSTNQLQVTLLLNTPYSWYVVSKSSITTATTKSDVWKFYNSGPGTTSYSPFPATLLTPAYGQNITATAGTANLTWSGSDIDNDIVKYDVFVVSSLQIGITNIISNVKNSYLAIPVTSGATYFWHIRTYDALGNASDSEIFQFTVN